MLILVDTYQSLLHTHSSQFLSFFCSEENCEMCVCVKVTEHESTYILFTLKIQCASLYPTNGVSHTVVTESGILSQKLSPFRIYLHSENIPSLPEVVIIHQLYNGDNEQHSHCKEVQCFSVCLSLSYNSVQVMPYSL
jgi:hypothetical protein